MRLYINRTDRYANSRIKCGRQNCVNILNRSDFILIGKFDFYCFSKKQNKDFTFIIWALCQIANCDLCLVSCTFIWALCQIANCDLCLVFLYTGSHIALHAVPATRTVTYIVPAHPVHFNCHHFWQTFPVMCHTFTGKW